MLRQRPVGHEARLAHSLTSETGHECRVGLCRTDVPGQQTDRWVGTGERLGLAAMCWVAWLGCGTRVDWECAYRGKELRAGELWRKPALASLYLGSSSHLR